MRVGLSADHAGCELKAELAAKLTRDGHQVTDLAIRLSHCVAIISRLLMRPCIGSCGERMPYVSEHLTPSFSLTPAKPLSGCEPQAGHGPPVEPSPRRLQGVRGSLP